MRPQTPPLREPTLHCAASSVQQATRKHTPYTLHHATRNIPVQHEVSHRNKDRWHTSRSMQHAALHATSFARHATSNVRVPCAANDATSIIHHATYNAPHATPCKTHNCQQRGSRTAVERAMLPPLKRTDPPPILTTPPSCAPPPRSAYDPIGLPMPHVPFGLRYRRSPQTRMSRCQLTWLAPHQMPAHERRMHRRSGTTTASHTRDATCSAHNATK